VRPYYAAISPKGGLGFIEQTQPELCQCDLISRDRATGLLNKIGLQTRAQELIRVAGCESPPVELSFGVIDIDKFKTINDTWGHYFGDIVIKRPSSTI
jgi:two-component system, cell cycle response regulator